MTTTTVKPADLQSGDRIIGAAGGLRKSVRTVVRVDRVAPGFVRTVESGKGKIKGKTVQGEWYETYHPNWNIEVER